MDLVNEVLPLIMEWMPEVSPPKKSVPSKMNDRVKLTAAILVIYMVMSQIPLYGSFGGNLDPFYQQRLVLGSTRGTIMELGISPLLTSGLITSFMSSTSFLKFLSEKKSNSSAHDMKIKEKKIQKFLGLLLCFLQALAYVLSGMYGKLDTVGSGNATIIVIQLFLAGVFIILFDDILSLGYGITNSGISLFIASNICCDVIWKALSPIKIFTVRNGIHSEFVGILPSIVQAVFQSIKQPSKFLALLYSQLFDRGIGLSTISNFFGTGVIILIISYFRNCQFYVPIHKKTLTPGGGGIIQYPVKLLYTGNMPIMLFASFINNIFIISQNMSEKYKKVGLVRILGVWKNAGENAGYKIPISGLSYYLTPPSSLFSAVFTDPTHLLIYTVLVVISCILFSHAWVEVSKASSKSVSQQLKAEGLVAKSMRDGDTIEKILDRVIPSATTVGGAVAGLIFVLSDLLGALGGGTGVMLAVATISECAEFVSTDPQFSFLSQSK